MSVSGFGFRRSKPTSDVGFGFRVLGFVGRNQLQMSVSGFGFRVSGFAGSKPNLDVGFGVSGFID